jgi:signal peptidase I
MLSAVTRLRIVWGGLALLVIAALAMYALNPYHVASHDPRARILGVLPFRAPSHSMEPTVKEGQFFLANVATLRNRDPGIGEIVVFRYPPRPDVMYLKRVVATGGMTIEMRHGVIYLDGNPLAEPYLPAQPITEMIRDGQRTPLPPEWIYTDMSPIQVPEHHFFLLGDNRGNSEDSRVWGFVPRELVVASYVRLSPQ